MRVSAYDYKVTPFFPHAYKVRKSVEAFNGTVSSAYSTGPVVAVMNDKFHGAINLPDDRVMFIPYSKGNIGFYTPSTGVYTEGPAVNVGTARYRGGCFHTDTGLVVMAPQLSPYIGLFDTKTDEFILGPNTGITGFHGAVVSSLTGKVILIPGSSPNVGIFDPVTKVFTQGAAHGGTTTTYFSSGEELPNGKILLVPYSAGSFKLYDPVTDTITAGPTGIASASFHGSVKLTNGDVVCVPYSATTVSIYRWQSNTMYNVTGPAGGAKFRYGAMAPDGRVVFCPYSYDRVGWYNPDTDAYEEGPALSLGLSSKWTGITSATTGQLILTPYSYERVGLFDAVVSGALPSAAMQSIQWNKS